MGHDTMQKKETFTQAFLEMEFSADDVCKKIRKPRVGKREKPNNTENSRKNLRSPSNDKYSRTHNTLTLHYSQQVSPTSYRILNTTKIIRQSTRLKKRKKYYWNLMLHYR